MLSAVKSSDKPLRVCRCGFLFFCIGLLSLAFVLLFSHQTLSQGQLSNRDDDLERLTRLGTDYLIDGEHKRAYATLTAAHGKGSARAAWTLATIYYAGIAQPADFSAAAKFAKQAAEQGDPTGARIYGWLNLRGYVEEDAQEARGFLERAARDGDAVAMFYLGRLLEQGTPGVDMDMVAAARWYERASVQSLPYANWRLGELLIDGRGGKRDFATGVELLELAADDGVVPAMATLGHQYFKGLGVVQNYDKAASYYYAAAKLGHVDAQNMIGYMLENDRGVDGIPESEGEPEADLPQIARAMLVRAAGRGHPQALFNLGLLFTTEDKVRAHAYFNLAAAQGLEKAVKERAVAEAHLSARELRRAHQLAASWKFNQPTEKMRHLASGSGFVISIGGAIVTNHHVVENCDAVAVRINNKQYDARVLAAVEKTDLALLQPIFREGTENSYRVARIAREDEIFLGEQVGVFGWPLRGTLSQDGVFTSGTLSAKSGPDGNADMVQISAPIQLGNSGGPVFGDSGRVIGVVRSQLDRPDAQNVNFAVKASVLRNFLLRYKQAFYVAESQTRKTLPTRELAELGRQVSVQILCYGFKLNSGFDLTKSSQ